VERDMEIGGAASSKELLVEGLPKCAPYKGQFIFKKKIKKSPLILFVKYV
jgi:hypothetical protein